MLQTAAPHPDCPFCLDNNLLDGRVLYRSDQAFLIEAGSSPGNFLVIPMPHIESSLELPDTWWQSFKDALQRIPNFPADYNIALNVGQQAGQRVKHLHFWIVPRVAGQPASGKGLARFISEANSARS